MNFFLTALLAISLTATTGPDWQLNFDKAKAEAKANHKLILLNFSGSDWCGPCIKLKKDIFESEAFLNYADKELVLVRADFPRSAKNKLAAAQTNHNESLAERYNPTGSFPLTVLLDADGKMLYRWTGYPVTMTPQTLLQDINARRAIAD